MEKESNFYLTRRQELWTGAVSCKKNKSKRNPQQNKDIAWLELGVPYKVAIHMIAINA